MQRTLSKEKGDRFLFEDKRGFICITIIEIQTIRGHRIYTCRLRRDKAERVTKLTARDFSKMEASERLQKLCDEKIVDRYFDPTYTTSDPRRPCLVMVLERDPGPERLGRHDFQRYMHLTFGHRPIRE